MVPTLMLAFFWLLVDCHQGQLTGCHRYSGPAECSVESEGDQGFFGFHCEREQEATCFGAT